MELNDRSSAFRLDYAICSGSTKDSVGDNKCYEEHVARSEKIFPVNWFWDPVFGAVAGLIFYWLLMGVGWVLRWIKRGRA